MVKAFIAVVLLGAGSLLAFVGNSTWTKKSTESTLALACATSLTTLQAKIPKQHLVSYGEFNDYVFKRVGWLQGQVKVKKMTSGEFQSQAVNLFSTYAPVSMKTCQTILEPSFKKCTAGGTSDQNCANESLKAFSFALKLVYDDSQALKQPLDLSKVVAFDIRTAIQQTRPRMPASEAAQMKNYATFLQ